MTFLAFMLVGGSLVAAIYFNSLLDKRAEKRRASKRPRP
jgi:hypothetical protein